MHPSYAFERAVLETIRTHAAIGAQDRVLVGVSGGADSTALLGVLEALRRRGALPVELAVGHLNHHLRGAESVRDAVAVRDLAARFALPCFVGDATDLVADAGNREARARAARHAFLAATGRTWRATRIALAHTRDDQAETVLLRLARGAGPQSLGAMRVLRADGTVRPLLGQPRAACVAYLEERGLGWVEDSSNADESLFRNRVRRRLLPLLEAELGVDVRARLARLAEQLREEGALAEQRIGEILRAGDGPGLPLASLSLASEGAPRLLHAWLADAGVRASARQVAALLGIARGERPSAALDLGSGWTVRRRYDHLELVAASAEAPLPRGPVGLSVPGVARLASWDISAEPHSGEPDAARAGGSDSSLVDLDRLPGALCVRAPAPGDRVRLVYGHRKLADILIDAKVPRPDREGLAVIGCGEDVLWVPGVVRSVLAGTSSETRRFAVLHAQRRMHVK